MLPQRMVRLIIMRQFTIKEKKQIKIAIFGSIMLYTVLLLGVFITLMVQTTDTEPILAILYGIFCLGLIMLFAVSWNQIPFKKVN